MSTHDERPDARVALLSPQARLSDTDRATLLADILRHPAPDVATEPAEVIDLVPGRTATSARRRWLPAVAAAAVVGVVVVGALEFGGDGTTTGSGGDEGITCRTDLPGSWSAAFGPVSTGQVRAASADGTVLRVTDSADGDSTWSLVPADGNPTPLTLDRGERAVAVIGPRVVTFLPTDPEGVEPGALAPVDVSVRNVRTGTRHQLLRDRDNPLPAGYSWTEDEPGVLDGVVYLAADETNGDGHLVIGYSIADDRFRIVARPPHAGLVVDPSGAWWAGGGVRGNGTPDAVPAALDDRGEPVRRLTSDGTTYAWQLIDGDQSTFHWATSGGRTGSFRLQADAGRDPAGLSAVAGEQVFLSFNQQAKNRYSRVGGNRYVLDLRTGALARTTDDLDYRSIAPGVLVVDPDGQHERRVDTAALPELAC